MRLPEYELHPLAPQPGDVCLCRIKTGRDEQGVMGTLLIPHEDFRLGQRHLGRGIHEVLEQMPRLGRYLSTASGIVSVCFGAFLVYQLGFVGGLLAR